MNIVRTQDRSTNLAYGFRGKTSSRSYRPAAPFVRFWFAQTTGRTSNSDPQLYGSVNATQNISWPQHEIGDIAFAMVESTTSFNTLTPSGWTALTGSPIESATDNTKFQVFYRVATSRSMAAFPIVNGSTGIRFDMTIIGGARTTGNILTITSAEVPGSASTTLTYPSLTTVAANSLILGMACRTDISPLSGKFTTPVNANLSNIVEHLDKGQGATSNGGIVAWSGVKVVPGATGTTTSTATASQIYPNFQCVLEPALNVPL